MSWKKWALAIGLTVTGVGMLCNAGGSGFSGARLSSMGRFEPPDSVDKARHADVADYADTTQDAGHATLADGVTDRSITTSKLAYSLSGQVRLEPAGIDTDYTNPENPWYNLNPQMGRLAIMASSDGPADSLRVGVQLTAARDSLCEPRFLMNLIWKDSNWDGLEAWPILLRARAQLDVPSTIFDATIEDEGNLEIHRAFAAHSTADVNTSELFAAICNTGPGDDSVYAYRAYGGQSIYEGQSRVRFVDSPVRCTWRLGGVVGDILGSGLSGGYTGHRLAVSDSGTTPVVTIASTRTSGATKLLDIGAFGTSPTGIRIHVGSTNNAGTGINIIADSLGAESYLLHLQPGGLPLGQRGNLVSIFNVLPEDTLATGYWQDWGRFFIGPNAQTKINGRLILSGETMIDNGAVAGTATLTEAADSVVVNSSAIHAGDVLGTNVIILLTPYGAASPIGQLRVARIGTGTTKKFIVRGAADETADVSFAYQIIRRTR